MNNQWVKNMLLNKQEDMNGGLPYIELGLYILLNSESGAIILPISQ
jgi:hypothetical protein